MSFALPKQISSNVFLTLNPLDVYKRQLLKSVLIVGYPTTSLQYGNYQEGPQLIDYFETKEEAVRHYEYLKQVYQSISAKETYSPYIFLSLIHICRYLY